MYVIWMNRNSLTKSIKIRELVIRLKLGNCKIVSCLNWKGIYSIFFQLLYQQFMNQATNDSEISNYDMQKRVKSSFNQGMLISVQLFEKKGKMFAFCEETYTYERIATNLSNETTNSCVTQLTKQHHWISSKDIMRTPGISISESTIQKNFMKIVYKPKSQEMSHIWPQTTSTITYTEEKK